MPRDPLSFPPRGWTVAKEAFRRWWLWEDDHDGVLGPFKSRRDASYEARIIIAERRIKEEFMHIRHINRGDIKEGGCSLCKPRRSREDRVDVPDIEEWAEGLDEEEPAEEQ
jgi:hypothetical protein